MELFGFHPLDLLIITVYLLTITWIGQKVYGKIHSEEDFFLAGRSINKFFQFFLNMGTLSDANSAIRTASFAFNKGLGGVWLMLIGVFTGPYHWFMAAWFRRVRLVTMAELFEERFKSKVLPTIYALVGIWLSVLIMGIGYKASLRTFQAMTIKPAEKCTPSELRMVELYDRYRELDRLYKSGRLDRELTAEYPELQSVEIERIDEIRHPEIANRFDYWYVPTFYVDGRKAHEGACTKKGVEAVLRSALS